MTSEPKQIVVPKEEAVFWLDRNGVWHNQHGRFEHPRIVQYFHESIKKDNQGYHLFQVANAVEEKVYFPYEDTALFVFDVRVEDSIQLVLNTNETLTLDSGKLLKKEDSLYLETREHRIKFNDRALMKISKFLSEQDGQLVITINDQTWTIS